MKSILVIFILWMLLYNCICSIIVVNKLNRKTHLTIPHDLLLSGLEQPLLKVQLHSVQLSKTCSIPKLPQSKLYSLHSTNANRETVLVIQEDNDECDISDNILEAKKTGYSGIIFCTNTIERFRNIKPIEGFYASVISNNDRFRLTQFNATRLYKISIFRDTSILEDLFGYLRLLLEWIIPSVNNVVAGIQILLVFTPVFILLAAYFLSSQRHQPYQSQDRPYQSRDQPFRNWEYEEDDDYNSSESVSYAYDDMLAYRKILNVGHDAGQKEIERAFRDRAFVLHPDKNVNLEKKERLRREEELKKCHTAKEALLEALHKKLKNR